MTRIKDAGATATAPAADDYYLMDGATNGSRKILGSNASNRILIGETVTSGSATNVSFTSIPSLYRDLEVVVRGRGTKAAANCQIRIRFNADTGANYDIAEADTSYSGSAAIHGGANSAVGQTSGLIGFLPANSATANFADHIRAIVSNYKGTTFQKAVQANGSLRTSSAVTAAYNIQCSSWWRSTSAITQIDIFPDSNAFVDGTVVSLYGIY